jgi:hypothetical protein
MAYAGAPGCPRVKSHDDARMAGLRLVPSRPGESRMVLTGASGEVLTAH